MPIKGLTAEEAIAELNALPKDGDSEELHHEAEELLCRFLQTIGHGSVVAAFKRAKNRVGFWYA